MAAAGSRPVYRFIAMDVQAIGHPVCRPLAVRLRPLVILRAAARPATARCASLH